MTTKSEPSPRIQFCTADINSTDGIYKMQDTLSWLFLHKANQLFI